MSGRDGYTRVYIAAADRLQRHLLTSATNASAGRLPRDVTEREVEKLTREYGRIRDIRILTGFSFVEFEDSRDARDCVRDLDGVRYDGDRLLVQPARAEGERRRPDQLRRGQYTLRITNLPPRCSWQDLKDLFRKVGDVVFTDVDHNTGEGTVEFSQESHRDDAIRQYDGYELNGSRIAIREGVSGGANGSDRRDDRHDDYRGGRSDERRDSRGEDRRDDRRDDRYEEGRRDDRGRGEDRRDRSRSPRRD